MSCPFIDIRDVDCDNDCPCETAAIRNADSQIVVSVLRFIVKSGSGSQLPCIRINTKRVPIAATQRIGQCIPTIRVCGSEGSTDVCAGSRVLRNRERCGGAFGERRCVVDVGEIDSDSNRVVADLAIRDIDGHRIRGLGFKVKGSICLELSGGRNNAKRCSICPTETVGERAIIRIFGRNRGTDVCAGSRVLRDGARRAGALVKYGWIKVNTNIRTGCRNGCFESAEGCVI